MTNARANPTGWTGANAVITAAQINAMDVGQARAIDGAGGGNYTPTHPISLKGQGIGDSYLTGALNAKTGSVGTYESGSIAAFLVGSLLRVPSNTTLIPDDNSDINPTDGQIRQHTTPVAAQRDHHLSASGNKGCWILIVRQADGGAHPVIIHRPGSAAAIVTLGDAFKFALIYDDGTNWRLGVTNGAAGADA